MSRPLRFILALTWLAAAAAGCGTRATRTSPGAETGAEAPRATLLGPYDQEKQEIHYLWMQIRQWRVEMRLGTEPPAELVRQYRHQGIRKLRVCPANPQPQTFTCRDTCNISEAICDNAESICRIADQLKGDSWARDKCESAKASCMEATRRCCECVVAESPGASASPPGASSPR